jgi:hypothetical protein
MRVSYWLSRVLCAAALLSAAACTTVTVTPQGAMPAAPVMQTYRAVAVGAIDVKQPEFAYLGPSFREGLVRRLNELKAFDTVIDNPATPPAPGTLMVTATVTEVDKGDAVLRFMIGMGAGSEHVAAAIAIKGNDGIALGAFDVRKGYAGGAGIGGASFIDIEDLVKQVGEQAAQSLVDWSQGKTPS